jgi:hypothetical protein
MIINTTRTMPEVLISKQTTTAGILRPMNSELIRLVSNIHAQADWMR